MKQFLAVAAALALPSCATLQNVDVCRNASVRRHVYTATIAVADAYALSGKPVLSAVALGRQAAATALAVLNGNCPTV